MDIEHFGEGKAFEDNWKHTQEANYLHWTRGEPQNQVQLAFRQHWLTFSEILSKGCDGKSILEVGCGRGSLSAYFADNDWDCTLLDLSESAIALAEKAFLNAGLQARFDIGNCLDLPYQDNTFDAVFSIGLLEHFDDIQKVLSEQYRILKSGGKFLGYVVPKMPDNLQRNYDWINEILGEIISRPSGIEKIDVYRSDMMSDRYIPILSQLGFVDITSSGIYSLPMISHSIEFPFTLLPDNAEKKLTKHFIERLGQSKSENDGANPWLCDEGHGQAFLLVATKS
ncbi:methyltransferase domain-containing protein [Alphaproteobacteria bacterium]|nr:methyltransferase domain-containing protein [Alphaproteobacteria bacterium]